MRYLPMFALFVFVFQLHATAAEKFSVEKGDGGVTVNLHGNLFTRYIEKSGTKPILYPIIGLHGESMTRAYPIEDAKDGERSDHPHHRSFWFTHGDVNGVSFWHEGDKVGTIEHLKYLETSGGETATIRTRNAWLSPDGTKFCEDERTHTCGADEKSRWIDFTSTVHATEGNVKFSNNNDGCFEVPVAGTNKVDAKLGGKIINSNGLTNKSAWGKPASWVDYHGPVDGKTVGIAILEHPSSFRHPTYWHVRTYGLFTANPFGLHNFVGQGHDGSYTLKAGESFTIRFRVLIHDGDEKAGRVAEVYESFAK